jgi:hypothetical protein
MTSFQLALKIFQNNASFSASGAMAFSLPVRFKSSYAKNYPTDS